jgi:hypothetical protein
MDAKAMTRRSRRLTAEHDARVNDESALANALMAETPGMTRDDALRTAARMLDNRNFANN